MEIINPATEKVIIDLKCDTPETLQEKYEQVQSFQGEWQATPFSTRQAAIIRFNELLAEKESELARILTQETGKPIQQSTNEIRAVRERVQFFIDQTEAAMATETHPERGGVGEEIHYEPLGVILNISAWNYPYLVGSNVLIPALLTGNTVLYKPSEFASLTGKSIVKLLHEAGIPEGALQILIGQGDVGATALELPINGVYFTGSHATGKKIAQAVAGRMLRLQLELGGKDPVYVCEDVDIPKAAASLADGAFYNAGQSCCAVERIYVHQSIYPEFVTAFVQTVKCFSLGDPMNPETYIGPLTRDAQRAVLAAQVKDAEAKGATLHSGGMAPEFPGYFFYPTVLSEVNHDMQLMTEESFGPIIGIQSVADDEEAIKLMNDTDYGLTAGIFTPDKARARSFMARLNAGSAYWNCSDRVSPQLPWTGRGHSGIGSTLSHLGIKAFLQPKAWHLNPSI